LYVFPLCNGTLFALQITASNTESYEYMTIGIMWWLLLWCWGVCGGAGVGGVCGIGGYLFLSYLPEFILRV
jgi:hypothetical protein